MSFPLPPNPTIDSIILKLDKLCQKLTDIAVYIEKEIVGSSGYPSSDDTEEDSIELQLKK